MTRAPPLASAGSGHTLVHDARVQLHHDRAADDLAQERAGVLALAGRAVLHRSVRQWLPLSTAVLAVCVVAVLRGWWRRREACVGWRWEVAVDVESASRPKIRGSLLPATLLCASAYRSIRISAGCGHPSCSTPAQRCPALLSTALAPAIGLLSPNQTSTTVDQEDIDSATTLPSQPTSQQPAKQPTT